MKKAVFLPGVVILLSLVFSSALYAQDQTVGLFKNEAGAFEGYTLFAPIRYKTTYLIDMNGLLVNKWESNYQPGQSVYLLENGNILRTVTVNNQTFKAGGAGGGVQEIDWDGNIVWEYHYSSNTYLHHHDVEMLPNGNVLMIAWELKSRSECIGAGRNPSMLIDNELWPDHIIEVEPDGATGGNIVWEWHMWDHLVQDYDSQKENYGVVKDHPELIDINFVMNPNMTSADWNHTNAIDYNEKFDQIVISLHNMSEIYVIDHSTTTQEAAGHAGGNSGKGSDILYRWGNPRVYDMGTASDQKYFLQHNSQWIDSGYPGAGNLLVFNNGKGRPEGDYSTIDEIVPPVDNDGNYTLVSGSPYGPVEQKWIYTADNPTDFYGKNISGAERLPNGNTLICNGPYGQFFEVTPDDDIVWEYVNPVTNTGPLSQGDPIPTGPDGGQTNQVFRCSRYAPDYPGLAGHDLTPGDPIEKDPWVSIKQGKVSEKSNTLQIFTHPGKSVVEIHFVNSGNKVQVSICSITGKQIENCSVYNNKFLWNIKSVPNGIYAVSIQSEDICIKKLLSIVR
jgi:hypothetical protein